MVGVKNSVVTVTGPSLSGKTELVKTLVSQYGFKMVVSCTTRPMREGEVHGVDYYFMDQDEFMDVAKRGELVQQTSYNGYHYGVTKSALNDLSGMPMLWVVAPQSIDQVKNYCNKNNIDFTSVFISNPEDVLVGRLFKRFKYDKLASLPVYLERLDSMLTVEVGWKDAYDYDIMINRFDEDNRLEVINGLARVLINKKLDHIDDNAFHISKLSHNAELLDTDGDYYDYYIRGYQVWFKGHDRVQCVNLYVSALLDVYAGMKNINFDMLSGGNLDGVDVGGFASNYPLEHPPLENQTELLVEDGVHIDVALSRVKPDYLINSFAKLRKELLRLSQEDMKEFSDLLTKQGVKNSKQAAERIGETLKETIRVGLDKWNNNLSHKDKAVMVYRELSKITVNNKEKRKKPKI